MSQDKRRKPRDRQKEKYSATEQQQKPPLWKNLIIQFLRGTIGLLENTVVKLENEQTSSPEKKPNLLQRMFLGWDKFLMTFRLFLPSNISNNLSDLALTVILGIITLTIVAVTIFFSTSQNTEIATLTPGEEISQPQPTSTSTSTSKSEPEIKPEIKEIPISEKETETKSEVIEIPTSTPEPEIKPEIKEIPISGKETETETKSEVIEIPTSTPEPEIKPEIAETPTSENETETKQEFTSTPTSKSEPELQSEIEETPILKPEPEIKLTPEQELIAAIKNQLSEITITIENQENEKTSLNLIKSIQANFRTSDLIITITDDWYNLEKAKQQQFAADILQRSQDLDFTHLQLVNSEDKLIARSPVVGNEMIIFEQ